LCSCSVFLEIHGKQIINFKEKANLIWEVADVLLNDYKQSDYSRAINIENKKKYQITKRVLYCPDFRIDDR